MGCRRGTVPSTVGPLVFASYSGLLGGAERVLLDWGTAAPPGSVLACPSGPLADAARRQGMTVLTLRGGDLELRGGARVAGRAGAALAVHAGQLRRLVRGLDPALVVAWGMRPALACATVPGLRFAFAHHDFLPAGRVGAAVRWAARRAALVTVPSAAVAADLGDVAVPVAVVAPGVEAARWSAIASASNPKVGTGGTAWGTTQAVAARKKRMPFIIGGGAVAVIAVVSLIVFKNGSTAKPDAVNGVQIPSALVTTAPVQPSVATPVAQPTQATQPAAVDTTEPSTNATPMHVTTTHGVKTAPSAKPTAAASTQKTVAAPTVTAPPKNFE